MTATVFTRLLAAAACLAAFEAQAQPAPSTGLGALRRITGACQEETVRFCPALVQSAPSPRDQYICLKAYKSSLSFNCRSAVNALSPH